MRFKLVSNYKPAGDQPQAIEKLVAGVEKGFEKQTLLGVTGSGKTFTIANVIEKTQKPTLVIAHNKTLAAQLCNEFREFFPENAVEYFVSYYDYYQPEAYLPHTDTYIAKEAQINEEIDRLRHACTQALLSRQDVIIVASVSAIYGLGSPKEYEKIVLHFTVGQNLDRRGMLEQLVAMQFNRVSGGLKRGTFRLTGPVFEIMPVNEEIIYRLEISDKIDLMRKLDPVTRRDIKDIKDIWLFPAKHYVIDEEQKEKAMADIKKEADEQLKFFKQQQKFLEAERIKRRINYDLELIKNIGYCNGIENYSRYFDGRAPGEPPFTLLDYFKESSSDFLTVIDESHVTVPQIRGMYAGDKSRKDMLIEHGFRLPSARDNRPLTYDEFNARVGQVIYTSATPDDYEIKASEQVVEQIVRPTGLIDPEVIVRPVTGRHNVIPTETREAGRVEGSLLEPRKGIPRLPEPALSDRRESNGVARNDSDKSQIEDLILRIDDRVSKGERVLVTTLTKKMAEDLNEYLLNKKYKVKYLHSDIQTLERIEIITDLRRGKIDVLVGVNLLREGLDMPEVSLVAILDADKEGFLRSETSLIQTMGRAARNVNGQVIIYADNITGSIRRAMAETDRRRKIQLAYNKKYGITPKTIEKSIRNILEEFGIDNRAHKADKAYKAHKRNVTDLDLLGDARPMGEIIKEKEAQMKLSAKELDFELAAVLRDEVRELRMKLKK